ncbi:MAG: hypothetical protein FWF77_00915, partial [Defluviitaleaceae bacterium]|nr:hypothetical protein [Defluviitaleaceae bacterium]
EAGCTFPTHKKRVGECHSPTLFCKIKKARQARNGHRGEGYIPAYTRTDFTDALHDIFGFRTDFQITKSSYMKKIFKDSKSAKIL